MSSKNPLITLEQILNECERTIAWSQSLNKETFMADIKQKRLFERELEIIGEAVGRLPSEITCRYPDVDWMNIAGLRHRIIHGYDKIDYDLVWSIISTDIPPLQEKIQRIIIEWKSQHE